MTPVDQEFLMDHKAGIYGDCLRAVLAALLDLPISGVPHFLQEAKGNAMVTWEALQLFCRTHGYVYMLTDRRMCIYGDEGHVYHAISGPSTRDEKQRHLVIGCNGNIVHDPHPSRAGLIGDPNKWENAFLVYVGFKRDDHENDKRPHARGDPKTGKGGCGPSR